MLILYKHLSSRKGKGRPKHPKLLGVIQTDTGSEWCLGSTKTKCQSRALISEQVERKPNLVNLYCRVKPYIRSSCSLWLVYYRLH